MYFLLKIGISALVIATVSELAKRGPLVAAILASLPLTSILAILWLHNDTQDPLKIISLSHGIFWAVLPSLLFFLVLPFLLKSGMRFGLAMIVSLTVMMASYFLYAWLLKKLGISL